MGDVDDNRILRIDDCLVSEQRTQPRDQAADTGRVPIANRGHLNDLTIDQLQALVCAEDTGFDHLVIFARGEAPRTGEKTLAVR